jgi:hypothetical protein
MSWQSNRSSQPQKSKEEIVYHLRQVNAILEQLAFDSSLTDDFKDPQVARAIKHWTNEHRLPPEEAAHFQDNYRVVSVLGKIHQLQNCCRQISLTVPLQLFLNRKPEMGIDFLSNSFGAEVGDAMYSAISQQSRSEESNKPSFSSATKAASPQKTIHKNKPDATNRTTPTSSKAEAITPIPAPPPKKVYGPSTEDGGEEEGEEDALMDGTIAGHCDNKNNNSSSSIFWSTKYALDDPRFSSTNFLFFLVGELLVIVIVGFLIAYLLKLFQVV